MDQVCVKHNCGTKRGLYTYSIRAICTPQTGIRTSFEVFQSSQRVLILIAFRSVIPCQESILINNILFEKASSSYKPFFLIKHPYCKSLLFGRISSVRNHHLRESRLSDHTDQNVIPVIFLACPQCNYIPFANIDIACRPCTSPSPRASASC